jgi:ABC-type sulfate transport system permease subunit
MLAVVTLVLKTLVEWQNKRHMALAAREAAEGIHR